jgi:hypothetical protein
MKRIKLFENFNMDQKVESANNIFGHWFTKRIIINLRTVKREDNKWYFINYATVDPAFEIGQDFCKISSNARIWYRTHFTQGINLINSMSLSQWNKLYNQFNSWFIPAFRDVYKIPRDKKVFVE